MKDERGQTDKTLKRIREIILQSYLSALQIRGVRQAIDRGNDDFFFGDHPPSNSQAQTIFAAMAQQTNHLLTNSIVAQWQQGERDLWGEVLSQTKGEQGADGYLSERATRRVRDVTADAFLKERRGGLTLSERVWNLSKNAKKEVEIIIQNGIKQGLGADQVSRSIRVFLNEPERLFRRVKNKATGELELSKASQKYHPGRGVYRSAYKNAMRLARTELRAAYLQAQWHAGQRNNLIVGWHIMLSDNHTTLKNGKPVPFTCICDSLVGDYPKWFKFVGWHPQCRCRMVPILAGREERKDLYKKIFEGREQEWSPEQVDTPPEGFLRWVDANRQRVGVRGSVPFFVRDNFVNGRISDGLRYLPGREAPRGEDSRAGEGEISALGEVAELVRKRAHEWGIDPSALDMALRGRNVEQVKSALRDLSNRAKALEEGYLGYVASCHEAMEEAIKKGVDASPIYKDLALLTENKAIWGKRQEYFRDRLSAFVRFLQMAQGKGDPRREANEKEVSSILGVKQQGEMSFEEANALRANPNYQPKYILKTGVSLTGKQYEYYGTNPKYRRMYAINCQSCVVANELRRRGFDVQSHGNTKRRGNIPYMLSGRTERAWLNGQGEIPLSDKTTSMHLPTALEQLERVTKEPGRYHVKWMWSGRRHGHIITCERFPDGSMRYYDPQNGEIIDDFAIYAEDFDLRFGIGSLRVDNLLINTDIVSGVVFASSAP